MGNVSYLVPSIHPMIKVAADGVAIHTLEFAEWARSADGDKAVLDGAKAMAMTDRRSVDRRPTCREATTTAFAGRPPTSRCSRPRSGGRAMPRQAAPTRRICRS